MLVKNNNLELSEIKYWPQHTSTCQEIDFHPNMPWIVSAGWDKNLKIYDVTSAQTIFTQNYPEDVRYVQFSLDGRFLAVATNPATYMYQVRKDRPSSPVTEIKKWDNGEANCWCLAFSPDSKLFAVPLFNGKIRFYSTNTWAELTTLTLASKTIVHGAFSPSSGFFAATGSKENEFSVINCQGPPETWHIQITKSLPAEGRKVLWTLNGQFLAVMVWSTESYIYNTTNWTINTHISTQNKALGADFSRDQNVLAIASESGHIQFYRYISQGTWNGFAEYKVKESFPWDVKFSPHNKWLIACYHDGNLQLMDYKYVQGRAGSGYL